MDPVVVDSRPAVLLWALLGFLLFGGDSWLGYKGYAYLTDVWRLGMTKPRWRIFLTLFWIFTTKHLFFGHVLPFLDPYAIIALFIKIVKRG